MNGRSVERLATYLLLFLGFGLPALLWAGGSAAGLVMEPFASELFAQLLVVGFILMGLFVYPVMKMVEGMQVAKFCRAISELDEMEKELEK